MKSQYIIPVITFILLTARVSGQVVTDNIHFDNFQSSSNNDFVNYFSGGNGITQLTTNGITGGSLDIPDSISWGNSNAYYCSKYHPLNDTALTSICFRYSSAMVHPASFQRAVSLWLTPSADFNHYIIGTINYNGRMELITYGWTNNPAPVAGLINNNWYKYQLMAVFTGGINNQVSIRADIYNLGTSGMQSPVLVATTSGVINDNILVSDTSISLSMNGARYGGAEFLDDFQFHGRRGVSTCPLPAGINDYDNPGGINVYPSPANDLIYIVRPSDKHSGLYIFNISGKVVLEDNIKSGLETIDVSSLNPGLYFMQIKDDRNCFNRKIIITR